MLPPHAVRHRWVGPNASGWPGGEMAERAARGGKAEAPTATVCSIRRPGGLLWRFRRGRRTGARVARVVEKLGSFWIAQLVGRFQSRREPLMKDIFPCLARGPLRVRRPLEALLTPLEALLTPLEALLAARVLAEALQAAVLAAQWKLAEAILPEMRAWRLVSEGH